MDAETSQDLQSSGKLEAQESQWCSSSLKARKLENKEEMMFQLKSKGRKRLMTQLKALRKEEFSVTQPFSSIQVFN